MTTVYVTHDQVEAMTMADRIALMNLGRLQQMDYHRERIYGPAPRTPSSPLSSGPRRSTSFQARCLRDGGIPQVKFLDCSSSVNGTSARHWDVSRSTVTVGFRPEEIRLASEGDGRLPRVQCVVEMVEPLGPETNVVARLANSFCLQNKRPFGAHTRRCRRCGVRHVPDEALRLREW